MTWTGPAYTSDGRIKWSRIDYCCVSKNLRQVVRSVETISSGVLFNYQFDHSMIHARFATGPLWDPAQRERIRAAKSSTSRTIVDASSCTEQQMLEFEHNCTVSAGEILPGGVLGDGDNPVDIINRLTGKIVEHALKTLTTKKSGGVPSRVQVRQRSRAHDAAISLVAIYDECVVSPNRGEVFHQALARPHWTSSRKSTRSLPCMRTQSNGTKRRRLPSWTPSSEYTRSASTVKNPPRHARSTTWSDTHANSLATWAACWTLFWSGARPPLNFLCRGPGKSPDHGRPARCTPPHEPRGDADVCEAGEA
ncbi:hypothetical protein BC828DRAFT_42037 [Blastocladiella britannica]|nr:hypothetical protein BC828DRAFT_42037 [Blastocladiella britannica]